VGDNLLEVERIYVRTAFLRNGYGTKLIQAAEEIALSLGVAGIWLGVWEHNQRALNFYSKMGFRHISQHSFFMADDEQIDLIYYKEL
jgi:ribosomal protein S18 acetylase RimI-like enzyme